MPVKWTNADSRAVMLRHSDEYREKSGEGRIKYAREHIVPDIQPYLDEDYQDIVQVSFVACGWKWRYLHFFPLP